MRFEPLLSPSRPRDRSGPSRIRLAVEEARNVSARLFATAAESDAAAAFAPETLHCLVQSGLTIAPFPSAFGGSDLLSVEAADALVSVLRLIGSGDLSVARLYEGHVNAVALVIRYGSAEQIERFADAVRGGAISAVWNAEGRRPLTAHAAGAGWTLEGEKILASGLGSVVQPIVTPRTSEGVIMLLPRLESGLPTDVSGWTSQGMRATATGTIDFTGLRVSAAEQIGSPGDYMRQPMFSGGAWRFCAAHLGAAERLLDLFREGLVERKRAEDPYQKQRVATASAAVISAALWITRAAKMVAEGNREPDRVVAFVNLTRMVTERAALDVIEAVQRGIGLASFMRPNPAERVARDLSTYLRQPVPDAAMADAARVILESPASLADMWEI